MFGGGHTLGADSGGTQGNQNLYLYGGTFTMYRSTRMNVAHDVMLAGTVMTIRSNSASDRSGPIFTIGDTLTISNTVETAQYIPMTIGWSTYRNAPTLVLSNQLVFVGNAINTNSTLIKREYNLAEETAKHAECALNGTVVFDIGDGAAVNDLEMDLTFADDATGSSAVPGRLVKEGAGTLMITSATNTLTGGIEINAGTLAVSGYFASGMSVAEEATLRVDTATVEINGDLMFEHNSTYAVSTLGAKTVVNGAVSGTGITWVTSPMPASNVSQVHLMHASGGMTQKFKTELPGWHCSVVGGTDLYLKPMPATILVY